MASMHVGTILKDSTKIAHFSSSSSGIGQKDTKNFSLGCTYQIRAHDVAAYYETLPEIHF